MPGITEKKASRQTPGIRKDPYFGYNFLVEIDGLIAGGFTEISGLSIQVEVERKMFGGHNDYEYKFFKAVKFPDLVLKRGVGDPDVFWNWYQDVLKGKIQFKDGSIYLLDLTGQQIRGWHFFGAYPIKWDGPTLNSASNTIAMESLTLTHHGLSGA
ncbi:MAG TPA: phage tail protein [Bacillota bacterium]|nr:phage tail protein [Bacillota bacterium]